MISDKRQVGLIVSYFLSRCDKRAVKALGYRSFRQAFQEIGDLLNENPNNIKNMRDEFDPYFDNNRKGWYQRPLRASRQLVFDEFESYSDEEVEKVVKNLLGMEEKGLIMENSYLLQDLGILIKESTTHYNRDFVWQDVDLSNEFKNAYEEYLSENRWKIEYFTSTAVITTPTTKNIFVPNQWFVIASYAVGVYSELHRYKKYFEKVSGKCGQKIDLFAKKLRDDTVNVDKTLFLERGKEVLFCECQETQNIEKSAKRLWRFVTDYSWWSGQKTIDRGDFYVSVILNMLNLVNASQGYVGDIVNAYGSNDRLKKLTRRLDAFTTNMEGSTYDIVLPAEVLEENDMFRENSVYETGALPHKIKISANSIKKIGGK